MARLFWAGILNIAIAIVEFVGGLLSGSLSIMSDALHNVTDAGLVGVSIVALKLDDRPKDLNHTFGLKRAQIIAAIFNSVLLILISLFLMKEAVQHLLHSAHVEAGVIRSQKRRNYREKSRGTSERSSVSTTSRSSSSADCVEGRSWYEPIPCSWLKCFTTKDTKGLHEGHKGIRLSRQGSSGAPENGKTYHSLEITHVGRTRALLNHFIKASQELVGASIPLDVPAALSDYQNGKTVAVLDRKVMVYYLPVDLCRYLFDGQVFEIPVLWILLKFMLKNLLVFGYLEYYCQDSSPTRRDD